MRSDLPAAVKKATLLEFDRVLGLGLAEWQPEEAGDPGRDPGAGRAAPVLCDGGVHIFRFAPKSAQLASLTYHRCLPSLDRQAGDRVENPFQLDLPRWNLAGARADDVGIIGVANQAGIPASAGLFLGGGSGQAVIDVPAEPQRADQLHPGWSCSPERLGQGDDQGDFLGRVDRPVQVFFSLDQRLEKLRQVAVDTIRHVEVAGQGAEPPAGFSSSRRRAATAFGPAPQRW